MIIRTALALTGSLAMAGAVSAQDVVPPSWASVPGPYEMSEAYPMFASMADIGGDVTLACVAGSDGVLALCRVVRAVPEGLGFEDAALQMTSAFKTHPRSVDGSLTPAEVQFTIRFRLSDDEIPSWRGPEPTPDHVAKSRAFLEPLMDRQRVRAEVDALDLQVDPEREAKLRAMIHQVGDEFEEALLDADALAMARIVSPDALAALIERHAFPPQPSDELLARAGDVSERRALESMLRLRALYCAQFDCTGVPSSRPGL